MTKSSVVDNETGKSMDSTVRTSTGTFFGRGQDEVLAAVEKRIAQVCLDCASTAIVSQLVVKKGVAQYAAVQLAAVLTCCVHKDII